MLLNAALKSLQMWPCAGALASKYNHSLCLTHSSDHHHLLLLLPPRELCFLEKKEAPNLGV